MLLNRSATIVVLVAVAGCGGLRRLPLNARDAGPTGDGGSAAGATGRGGTGGGAVDGGPGGSAGGSTGGVMIVDGGSVDAPVCVAGGACVPANPCHKGQFVCIEGAMSCMDM